MTDLDEPGRGARRERDSGREVELGKKPRKKMATQVRC